MQKLLLIVTTCFIFLNSLSGQTGVYSISGKITDKDGSSLAGAGVYIESGSGGTTSGPDGSYSLSSLKEGTYTIRFSFLGYETQTRKTDVHGNTILNVSLEPSAVLTNEVLVNATRAGEHTPLAYAVIERDELRKTGFAQDMPYLLGLTPSLVETSEAGNGVGYTSLRIRGTDANRINVTVDGIPLNDPESQQVFWVDLPDLASSVDNIQIQRGVGTSSNGAGAFGATISVQTLNPDKEPGAEISSSYGSFNTMKNTVSAGTGLLAGKFAFQMRYSDIRSDGYIDRTGSHHQSAFLTGVYRSGKSRLKANIILGKEHTGIGWWGVPKDSLKTNRKYNPAGEYTNEYGELSYYPNESDNYDQNHYQLIYTYSPHENLNINAAIHYTKGKGYYEEYRDDQDLREYNMSPFSIGSQVITSTDMIRRKWMDNDFYGMVYSLNYHINRAELIVGGGLNRYQGDHFGKIIWMRNAGNSEKDFEWYFNNSLKDEISIYGKLNYDLAEKIRLYGDLQLRSIHYNMSGFDDDLKDLGQGHRFNFFNPKAGLFYTISQNQDAWLSFSVAHREPTRSDYKEASGDAEATPKPETLYDTEAGYKFEGQNGSLSTSLYAMIYHDQLVPTGELSDVGYSIMTNVGKSYRLGVEISGSLRITDNISWNSSLTLSRNKISDFVEYYTDYNTNDWSSQYLSKNLGLVDIAYSPSQVWSNDLDFHKGIFSIHLISKFVGKQYFDNTRNPERTIDPYFVNNLRLDVTPKLNSLKQLDIQLLVNNILNERYENNAYGGNWYEDGQEKTWSYYFPQAGTNYMLRLGFKF
ncbi:MAG TPA: TonB-dependent receptor [Bacteroidales bacterium]|nr:TonB-dependent receptor [Bacteroidales bacterium]